MEEKIKTRLAELDKDLAYWAKIWEEKASKNDWDNMQYEGLRIATIKALIQELNNILEAR
jgi:hypothetical protein